MNFIVNRSAFLNELAIVQRAISSKTTIPILTGLKLVITSEGIYLTGSNSNISIEIYLAASNDNYDLVIENTGSVVLPARFFGEIIRKLPEDKFSLKINDDFSVDIKSGNANFTLKGFDTEKYPKLPLFEDTDFLKIPAIVFNKIVNETSFAVSTQEIRPILTGVHFQLEDGLLTAVATDSHRLSQRQITVEAANFNLDMIVPGKSLTELTKSIKNEDSIIEIGIQKNQILFKTENMYFYSRLLEGKYPDTKRLIPNIFKTEIEFSAQALLNSIDRASLFSSESKNNIVHLNVAENEITLTGNTPEVGNVTEALEYKKFSGDPLTISFNPDYMKVALRAFGQRDIMIKFISPIRPFIIEPSEANESYIQLITPVRTH